MIAGILVALGILLLGRGPMVQLRQTTPPRGKTDVAAVAMELSALLRAGAGPARAWELATAHLPPDPPGQLLGRAADELALGRSPHPVLQEASDPGLRALAAAWWVGEHAGAPLGQVLAAVADAIRDGDDASRARQTAMAGPVTTARILCALPVVGLVIGQAIGARPVQTLFGTGYGRVCAVVGLGCAAAGIWWTSRLITAARGQG